MHRARPRLETLEDRCVPSAGQLDPTFGNGGIVTTDIGGPTNNEARAVAASQGDGKVVVVGNGYSSALSTSQVMVARYNTDGSLDTGFGSGGEVNYNGTATAVSVDAAGRIVVAGTGPYDGSQFVVTRLKADGSFDTSFGSGGVSPLSFGSGYAYFQSERLAIDSSGDILIAGTSSRSLPYPYTDPDFAVARLHTDGSLDTSFGSGGLATVNIGTEETADLALDSAGHIVIAGTSLNGATGYDFAVARLNADGSLDTSFGSSGKTVFSFGTGFTSDRARGVAIDSGGHIVVAGYTDAYYFSLNRGTDFAVARLNADGSLDTSFGSGGKTTITYPGYQSIDVAAGVVVDASNRVVIAGTTGFGGLANAFAVTRLKADGTLDGDFGSGGEATVSFSGGVLPERAAGVIRAASNRIVVAGTLYKGGLGFAGDFALTRLDDSGNLDSSWGSGGRVTTDFPGPSDDGPADLTVSQPDGKIVVAGVSDAATGRRLALTRYNTDGSLDNTFGSGGKVILSNASGLSVYPKAVSVDSAGRILVAGDDPDYYYYSAVLRLNPDGSADTSFGSGGRVTLYFRSVADVAVDGTGYIVVGGTLVTRLNENGSLDTGFGSGGQANVNFDARDVTLDASGRIIVAGTTSATYASTGYDFAVARLNANGSLDTGFGSSGETIINYGTHQSNDIPVGVALDPSGHIVVAGTTRDTYPDFYDDHPAFALARLNTDGSLDPSFGAGGKTTFNASPAFNFHNSANCMAVDAAGRIAVVGTTVLDYYGPLVVVAALFKPDGSPDIDFGVGGKVTTSAFGNPAGAAFDAAGRLVVAGSSNSGTTGADFAVVRFQAHDPVVEASSATFAADLQTAVTALDSGTPAGTPCVIVHVANQVQLTAALSALAGLTVNPAGPAIEVLLDLDQGTYSLGTVSVPVGLKLIIDGNAACGPRTFTASSGPVLTLLAGDVVIRDGAVFTGAAGAPVLLVQGGRLSVQDSTISASDTGTLIRLTGPNDVDAFGAAFQVNGYGFNQRGFLDDNFGIEDLIDHSLDGLGGGTVFWVRGNVFVTANSRSVQRGVDVVPVGGTVNVQAGVHGDYRVGSKLLTVFYADGWASITQQADTLDASKRELFVGGTWASDTIRFAVGSKPGEVQVNINKLPRGTFLPTGRLIAQDPGGDNDIVVDDQITLTAWLFSGYGNSRLKGGGGNNVLVGGWANDTLIGGAGRNLIISGGGTDRLVAGSGDSLLIAGVYTYAYDEAAIDAVMREWTRTDAGYATRVGHLLGTLGGGLNGAYFLTSDRVWDDESVDVVTGGSGQDWFLVGLVDKITNQMRNEIVTTI
jgi:uncharacterized delta-60 repeat protein